jgi:hypothetical protein
VSAARNTLDVMRSQDHVTDRGEALARLPAVYSLALRLRDAHLPDDLIAECLRVEPEAVGPLLDMAEAKLAALLRGG